MPERQRPALCQLSGLDPNLRWDRRTGQNLHIQILVKVIPMRVVFLNQPDLPIALPCLDLIFARFGGLSRVVHFIPDKPLHIVFSGESRAPTLFVIPDTVGDVISMPAIKRAALLAGEKIDIKSHSKRLALSSTPHNDVRF